jgi:hypothetical protein
MIRFLFLLVFFTSVILPARAQKPADESRFVNYRSDALGGFIIHNEGWGAYFRYGRQLTYNKRISYSLDVVGMHHPKEIKVFNPNYDDGKGYYYGKLNALHIVRPGIGLRRIYFEKIREKGVEISVNYSAGASIGLVRPVYLQILYPTSDPIQFTIQDEKYDPAIHTIDNIYGRSKGGKGWAEVKFNPGGFAKIGFQFEYANEDDAIRSIEVGISTDYFVFPVEIMANNSSTHLFFSTYIKFLFGRKYF